jgi:hypothetical protein
MRPFFFYILTAAAGALTVMPQGRPVDWPSLGGDARRSGWERSDIRFTKENVKSTQLILKRKFDGASGQRALTPPVVIGLLISYKGFKELGFGMTSSGELWSIDLDLNKPFWQRKLDVAKGAGPCAMATVPTLNPPAVFGRRPGAPKPSGPPPVIAPVKPVPTRLGGGGFGVARPVFMVTGDGKLHQMNTSDGTDQFPPLEFLPAGAKASNLVMSDNAIYAVTTGNCGGAPNAVWSIDLTQEPAPVTRFAPGSSEAAGLGGFAVGNDGTVYVQTTASAGGDGNRLVALASKTLQPKAYLVTGSAAKASAMNSVTPAVFEFMGRDLVATVGSGGELMLADSRSLGGADNQTALARTQPLSVSGGVWGGITTWEDNDGVRWIAAPVWGAVNPALQFAASNGPAPNGSVVAFRVEEQGGKYALAPGWVSRDLTSPVPPVTTGGIVFALSTGGKAVLYALDGANGKEMYSTGTQVTAAGSLAGMTVANGRVFFSTVDGSLYGFGIFLEI